MTSATNENNSKICCSYPIGRLFIMSIRTIAILYIIAGVMFIALFFSIMLCLTVLFAFASNMGSPSPILFILILISIGIQYLESIFISFNIGLIKSTNTNDITSIKRWLLLHTIHIIYYWVFNGIVAVLCRDKIAVVVLNICICLIIVCFQCVVYIFYREVMRDRQTAYDNTDIPLKDGLMTP